MSFNVNRAVQIPLDVFGGLVTNMPAANLPSGVSPDCQDVVFRPGAVGARPAIRKVFATPFGSATVTYAKSYIDKKGVFRNLYLDSLGNLWVEDLASAGTYNLLATTTPGSYAKSITAFGREYIAISDGLLGADVPLQYDGTYLDRVTQDGPGSPPTIANLLLPPVNMVQPAGGGALTITTAETTDLVGSFYTTVTINVTSGAAAGMPGDIVTIAGNGNAMFNTVFGVIQVVGDTQIIANIYSATFETGAGGTATIATAFSLQRSHNIVTVNTATAHGLQVGYQAQISEVPAAPISFVSTITINNTDAPGIATVVLSVSEHGLASGEIISLSQVDPVTVGGTISSLNRQGGAVTAITTGAHGLRAGVSVNIVGPTNATFAGTFTVLTTPTLASFTYAQVDTDATSSAGGTVTLNWPLAALPNPELFEIISIPTPNSFTIALHYSDGVWTSGAVFFPWDGIFYVSAVPTSTSFQYRQYGPDATSTVGGSPANGKVTPFGQVSPGKHQMQVLFETRQGYVTAPSPPTVFNANGGQYLAVSNIPIGPSNVIARILAFTGTDGAYFFYIPVPAQVNGQVVSTETRIPDNTTTAVVLDFGDNTLFSSLGISVPGNNLAQQIVLDGALGFGLFAERLITYGQRNRVLNFLNLGFDGGYLPSTQTIPTGWTAIGDAGGALATGHYGDGWTFSGSGSIEQSAYLDAYGAPILTGNTQYKLRAWIKGVGATATLTITGGSPVSSITATITGDNANGSWQEADFSGKTPVQIPADMVLSLTGTGGGTIDEISIIFSDVPAVQGLYGSYVDNPEGFDGVTGFFGPADDTHQTLAAGIIRSTLFLLTRDPAGRLHSVQNSGTSEPAGWTVNEVAAMCGVLSAFALTVSQSDDATAGGGEEWMAWMSFSGARLFGGDQPWKISEEIQPDWNGINSGAYLTCWALNDPSNRVIYFGLPKGLRLNSSPAVNATAPNLIYPVDYKELDGAYQIAQADPIQETIRGRVGRDAARKWTRWNIPANGAAQIYRAVGGPLVTVLFSGNGAYPNTVAGGCGNTFTICGNSLTDDCLGAMAPYYFTYAFTSAELEQGLQLGGQRHLLTYLQWYILGVGTQIVTPYVNTLSNPWPITSRLPLRADPTYDDEWGGGNAQGQRIFFKFEVVP